MPGHVLSGEDRHGIWDRAYLAAEKLDDSPTLTAGTRAELRILLDMLRVLVSIDQRLADQGGSPC